MRPKRAPVQRLGRAPDFRPVEIVPTDREQVRARKAIIGGVETGVDVERITTSFVDRFARYRVGFEIERVTDLLQQNLLETSQRRFERASRRQRRQRSLIGVKKHGCCILFAHEAYDDLVQIKTGSERAPARAVESDGV